MRLAAERAIQEGHDCSVSAAEAEMEIPAKVKPVIEVKAIAVNTKTTVEIEANPGVPMGGTRNP